MTKYRGLRLDGKGWVEGYVCQYQGVLRICNEIIEHPTHSDPAGTWIYNEHEIHPESLSLFTGLTDKNGKEIFGSIPIDGVMSKGGSVVKTDLGVLHYTSQKWNVVLLFGAFQMISPLQELPISFVYHAWDSIMNDKIKDESEYFSHIEIIGNQYEQNG